ncbi:Hint domain-containing protein [Mangrovicoccus ximenensis]|uniref:Hint domain-containing protein n=1 Tax=Mangrovicoccus ximenensis TaxID=1911570 RepID=UPI000D3613B1|nr:Hint domain-containing protein [Mangrovicoccus ximenensis]
MATTFDVIYLGTFATIDNVEGNALADNAAALNGLTVGSADQPLWKNIQSFSPGSTGYGGGISSGYDQSNSPSETFRINGGADQTFDAGTLYNGTITFVDGSTATARLILIQDTTGHTYLAPTIGAGPDADLLASGAIQSISITSVNNASWDVFEANRVANAFSHPDVVDGTAGNDSMGAGFTDAQGDRIEPNAGAADSVAAGAGNDTINTGAGNDTVWAGDGNDVIYATRGNDSLMGEGGDDRFIYVTGDGADTVSGGTGTDTLDFSTSTGPISVLYSGAQAGTFSDGSSTSSFSGIERLTMTSGNDTIDAGFSSGSTWIDGGAGDDRIEYGSSSSTVFGGDGNDFIDDNDGTRELGNDYLDGGAGNDSIYAGQGQDTVHGGSGNDIIYAEDGNDLVYGGDGSDTVDGSSGNDTIYGGDGADSLAGGTGADSLYGDGGNDTVFGGDGADRLEGGSGNDILWGGSDRSADTLLGGDDSDTLFATDGFGASTFAGGEGGTDWDMLNFGYAATPVTVTYAGSEAGTATNGTDTLTFSQIEAVSLTGGNDSLDGSASSGPMTVWGGAGSDTIRGGSGADSLSGGDGDDHIYSGDGADTVSGGAGNDLLVTGAGNDSVTGGDGNDTILAEFGDDTINAGAGDDVIGGSLGRDLITTGTGKDRIIVTYNDLQDTITDFDMADDDSDGLSNDQLDVSGLTGGRGPGGAVTVWDVTVTDDGAGNAVLTFPGAESVVLMGVSAASLSSPAALRATGIPCFTPGTMIETEAGPVAVERLRPGDRLGTADAGFQPVLWTAQSRLGTAELATRPEARPVLIRPGGLVALSRPILVSPQHCMAAEIGGQERFVRARHLTGLPGGMAEACHGLEPVTYVHVLLPSHQVIFAEGARTESLWPGPMAVAMLPEAERAELLRLLPWLAQVLAVSPKLGREIVRHRYGPPARPEIPKKLLNRLARGGAQPPNSRGRNARSAKLAAAGRP